MNFNFGFGTQPGNLIRCRTVNASNSMCFNSIWKCDEFVDRIVNGTPISTAVYTASNSITSLGDVNGMSVDPMNQCNFVIFQAGVQIEMTPGFEAIERFIAQVVNDLCETGGSSIIATTDLQHQQYQTIDYRSENLMVYPNPAIKDLHLVYTLTEDSDISIRFTNQYGQVVRVIADNQLQSKGSYMK